MYKNRLREIIQVRKINQNWLAEQVGITRQGLRDIMNDPFRNVSINVVTRLMEVLDVSFSELGEVYKFSEYLNEQLIDKCFNEKNLEILSSLVKESTGLRLHFSPYSNKQSLNFHADRRSKKDFSGNIRINVTLEGLTFEIVDFDFYTLHQSTDINNFLSIFSKLINAFESYAQIIGFNLIVFHVEPYFNRIEKTQYPYTNLDFSLLRKKLEMSKYTSNENELVKLVLLINRGFTTKKRTSENHTLLYSKLVNNSVLSPEKIGLSYKEPRIYS
ncbi:helix-turn-helix transcriptional regulator [Enterococcus gilvus]|uniref:helix-turn-helix domain-containing protein n=1 Tax=Enterococcus gilvus TaxID=160453 RepID=UPI0028D60F3C|nr:helix-turn-helix transcriptional regulator [Enterococcus gilvus]